MNPAPSVSVGCVSQLLRCEDGLPLGLDLYRPVSPGPDLPLVLLGHGFKGFRRWGMFPHLAQRLAASGRAVALFDLSHNGTEPGHEQDFTRLDLFERQTVERHLADWRQVLDWLGEPAQRESFGLGSEGASLVGHSLGGGLALLTAARDDVGQVAGLVTLNGVSRLQRISAEARAQLEREGRVIIPNARTGQDMPLGREWFAQAARTDLEAAARGLSLPSLILSGEVDSVVPPDEARALAEWIPGSRLVTIPAGDHTLGARHPWAGWTEPLHAAVEQLDAFLPGAP